MINFKPVGDRVLVEPIHSRNESLGLIHIPEAHRDNSSSEATVIAVGTGKTKKNGQRSVFEVAMGDRIIMNRFTGIDVEIGRKRFKLLDPSEILATID